MLHLLFWERFSVWINSRNWNIIIWCFWTVKPFFVCHTLKTFTGTGYTCIAIFLRETNLETSCLLYCTPSPFWKGSRDVDWCWRLQVIAHLRTLTEKLSVHPAVNEYSFAGKVKAAKDDSALLFKCFSPWWALTPTLTKAARPWNTF